MARRVDGFKGNEQDYVAYLEREIFHLRSQQLSSSSNALSWMRQTEAHLGYSGRLSNSSAPHSNMLALRTADHPAKRSKVSIPAWKRRAEALVKKTPLALDWWTSLRAEGIYEVMCNGTAVAYLLGDAQSPPIARGAIQRASMACDDLALLRHVAQHAEAAFRRRLTASVAIRLAHFQQILVLSSCAAIRSIASTSVPHEELLEIVKICIGEVSDAYCDRMLDTAVFINRLIDVLNAHGWEGRAAELLLWCKTPPNNIASPWH